jgi:hypothetical protein
MTSSYGADRELPCVYTEIPNGLTEGTATYAELRAVGFHQGVRAEGADRLGGPRDIPIDFAGRILRDVTFRALRDPAGKVVATWDEGRWWTPSELEEFQRRIIGGMLAGPGS